MKLLLAALALGGLAAPTMALPAAAQTAPSPDLDRLVRLLIPDSTMLELAMKGLENSAPAPDADGDPEAPASTGDAEADLAALYARYPGMKEHVVAQLRPEMARLLQRELPALRTQIAAILTAELTPAEVTDAATFFASPTGQKIYAAAIAALGEKPGGSDAQTRETAMNAAMASLTPEDYPALMAFGASGASKKMGTINPKIGAASKAWAARLIVQNGDRMRAIALRAANDFRKKGKP